MKIKDLINAAKKEGFSLDTEIKIMGVDVQHYKFILSNEGEVVILDECPIDEEED